jgi:hypothetical protein
VDTLVLEGTIRDGVRDIANEPSHMPAAISATEYAPSSTTDALSFILVAIHATTPDAALKERTARATLRLLIPRWANKSCEIIFSRFSIR